MLLGSLFGTQIRCKSNVANKSSLLQIFYKRHCVRKKFLRALKRGQLVSVDGQIRIPPLAMQGYDETRRPYRGSIENCRAPRLWFKD